MITPPASTGPGPPPPKPTMNRPTATTEIAATRLITVIGTLYRISWPGIV